MSPNVPESMLRAVDFAMDDDEAELTVVRFVPAPEDDDGEAW